MPATSDRPSLVAWLDLSAGVAGDMLLGALLDAGAPLPVVRDSVEAVLPGTVTLATEEVTRAGIRATRLTVDLLAPDQPHRTWTEIRERLTAASLAPRVRDDALSAFGRLAAAEARVHGTAVDASGEPMTTRTTLGRSCGSRVPAPVPLAVTRRGGSRPGAASAVTRATPVGVASSPSPPDSTGQPATSSSTAGPGTGRSP
jgi:hypothetical protein